MKLQNLLYATMVACAFSACSNDDDPNIPDPALEMDATLTALFNTVGDGGSALKSKAGDDAKFNNVEKIGIGVFNNGALGTQPGTLISYQEQSATGDTTACVAAKSGAVSILVIANPESNMFNNKTTLDEFLGAIDTKNVNDNKQALLMSSTVMDLTLMKGRNVITPSVSDVENTTEDQILAKDIVKLYRNVARVEVPKITLNPREGFGKGQNVTFTLKSIFMVNVRQSVRVGGLSDNNVALFSAKQPWCSVVNKASDSNLSGNIIWGSMDSNEKSFNPGKELRSTGDFSELLLDQPADLTQLFAYDNASNEKIQALKSDNKATLLVIKGDYEYQTPTGTTVKAENSFWTVPINNVDLTATTSKDFPPHYGILRNVKYVISPTITGPGSGEINPESTGASLTVKFEVVNWGEVELHPDID